MQLFYSNSTKDTELSVDGLIYLEIIGRGKSGLERYHSA